MPIQTQGACLKYSKPSAIQPQPRPADAASGLDGFGYQVDGSAHWTCDGVKDFEEGTTSVTLQLPTGTWFFHLCAVDNAGNAYIAGRSEERGLGKAVSACQTAHRGNHGLRLRPWDIRRQLLFERHALPIPASRTVLQELGVTEQALAVAWRQLPVQLQQKLLVGRQLYLGRQHLRA